MTKSIMVLLRASETNSALLLPDAIVSDIEPD
jgi:hypothetical protein